MKRIIAPLALAAAAIAAPAQAATPVDGQYLSKEGDAVITVAPCGAKMCGKISKIIKARPGAAKTDVNNPDPSLRDRPILGLPILYGFEEDGNQWDGTIYNPEDGKSYKSEIEKLSDGRLKVKGCVLFICQTQYWRPYR